MRVFRLERWHKRHALRHYASMEEGEGREVMEVSGRSGTRPTSYRKERGHREQGVGDAKQESGIVQARGSKK